MGKGIIASFVIWRIFLIGVVLAAHAFLPTTGQFTPYPVMQRGLPYWVWVWANFDGVHYVTIAIGGYFFNLQPFFPLYPFAIRLANDTLGFSHWLNGPIIAGQVVSSLAFIVSLFLVQRLLRLDQKEKLSPVVSAAMFLYPTAFFYTAVYNDALFLLLACLTILGARRRLWLLASFYGALATLTRLNGLALIFLVIAEYIDWDWKFSLLLAKVTSAFTWKKIIASGILWVLAIPGAFLGYLLYIHRWFGTWRWVFTSMQVWQQDRLTFPLQVVWRYLKILVLNQPFTFTYWVAVVEFAFVLFHLVLLIYAWKKIRFSYWLFFAVSILIPSLTGTFQGMPRYGLHLYPLFLVLGMLLSNKKRWSVLFFVVSAFLEVAFLALFSRGWFIS